VNEASQNTTPLTGQTPDKTGRLLAGGGIIGALLASSCCIVPLILVSLGISGAWIGSLRALEPYKPVLAIITLAFLAAGFRQVYFKKPKPCADGTCCARPASVRLTKTALWLGTLIVIAALTIKSWAPLFY